MEINHSANFTNFNEFIAFVQKRREESIAFNFSGNVSDNENDNDNFSVNWTSDKEV